MLSLRRAAAARRVFGRAQPRRAFSRGTAELGQVPVLDFAPLRSGGEPTRHLVDDMARACSSWGFFQVVNHGLDAELRLRFEAQMHDVFSLPTEVKRTMKRDGGNARGWYDDELTKQRRDWKQGLDFGMPASRSWSVADDHVRPGPQCDHPGPFPVVRSPPRTHTLLSSWPQESNANLDGYNRFPPAASLPGFRSAVVDYFEAATKLSEQIALVMALGLGLPRDYFADQLRETHTSYDT